MKSEPSTSAAAQSVCPTCGAPASGKFCSECGASLGQSRCASCGVELIEGSRFCHRCGLPAGASPPEMERTGPTFSLPWIVAAIALLALIALVAGQRFAANRPETGAIAAETPAGADAGPQGTRATTDISQMSPNERAMRLYDRLMFYNEQGKRDSLLIFAPMAIEAYGMLGPLDADGHYDLGRIGEVSGDARLAVAHSDSILQRNPNHLLGLILAAHAARMENRTADERRFYQRLVAAEPTERKKQLPEYLTHDRDIVTGLDEARRTIRR